MIQTNQHVPMTYGRIPGVSLPVSRLIMGTMIYSPDNLPFTCAMLDHFVSLGGNTLDTARIYGGGKSERAIGAWMQQRCNRDRIVIVGKGAHPDVGGPRVSPTAIAEDLAASLEALQTDYIDLHLLHRDDPGRPVGEIIESLNEHRAAGRVRAFGASNWTAARIEEANTYAREHGLVPFAAGSPNLSLAIMNEPPWAGCISATVEGREWYREHQFPLLAWSSQAQGFFTGRCAADDRSNPEMVRVWYSEENFARLARATELGRERGVSANTIALAYVLCQPLPTFALIGPRTADETSSSMEALRVELTPDDVRWLEAGTR